MILWRKWWPWLLFGGPIAVFSVWAIADNPPLYFKTLLNGLTLASLYFLVASGFTLVFGLMRNVNLAHGSLYLFGAYVGWVVGERTGSWVLAVAAGFLAAAILGLLLQVLVFRFMQGQDLRQTLVTIGISIVLADLMLVDGDPLANLSILREPKRILAVMKDGVFAKRPEMAAQRAWGRAA